MIENDQKAAMQRTKSNDVIRDGNLFCIGNCLRLLCIYLNYTVIYINTNVHSVNR